MQLVYVSDIKYIFRFKNRIGVTSIYLQSIYVVVNYSYSVYLKVCNIITVFPLPMLAHRKLNRFELKPNREFLKQGGKNEFFPLMAIKCSRYFRTDYIDMFFHVKCLSVCILTFDLFFFIILCRPLFPLFQKSQVKYLKAKSSLLLPDLEADTQLWQFLIFRNNSRDNRLV